MRYEPTYKQMCKACGISATNALEIAQKPDQQEIIEFKGIRLVLSKKHVAVAKPPAHVLVVTAEWPGHPAGLEAVLKVYDNFANDVGTLSPTDLLRRMMERFGCEIRFNGVQKRLYLAESIPTKDLQEKPIPVPGIRHGKTIIANHLCAVNHDGRGGFVADCGLSFAFDSDLYADYLAGREKLLA